MRSENAGIKNQLDRMAKILLDNRHSFYEAVSKDFKNALQEKVFEVEAPLATIEFTKLQLSEWMKPVAAMVPKALADLHFPAPAA